MIDNSPTPTAPFTPAPTVTPHVEPHTKSGLAASEAEQMMDWLKQDLAQGRLSPEQAAKAFDQLNATAEQRAPDTHTEEAKHVEAQFGSVAQPHEYTLRFYTPGQEPREIPKEVREFDTRARGWMHDMGLSKNLGDSLAQIVSKQIQHTSTLSPEQRESYKERENDKLRALYGGQEKLVAALEPARQMVQELERTRPGIKAFIAQHGDHALFVNQLIQASKIYHERKGH